MKEKFVGFYWTLPVRMAGFTHLPSDAEEAAKKSRTIRYQRQLVRVWLDEQKQDAPIKEFTFLEVQDDRGSDLIKAELEKVSRYCKQEKATLLLVGFGMGQSEYRARRHGSLVSLLKEWKTQDRTNLPPDQKPIKVIEIPATPIDVDGRPFDPEQYFRRRRAFNRKWAMRLRFRAVNGLREALKEAQPGPGLPKRIVEVLNEKGIKTANGKRWTTDNVERAIENLKATDRIEKALQEVPASSLQYENIARILNRENIRHYSGDPWTDLKVKNTLNAKLGLVDPILTENEMHDLMMEIERAGG